MVQQKGLDFEYEIQTFFEERGFPIFETPQTNDYGADLILYYKGTSLAIQCKCYTSPVGISAIQEVVAAVAYYQTEAGVVIANQSFTRQAKSLAQANRILLIDKNSLCAMLADVSGDVPILEKFITEKESNSIAKSSKNSILISAIQNLRNRFLVKPK